MFSKIKDFLFGKDPVQSPVAAPYKIDTSSVNPMSPVKVEAIVPEAVVVTPEAVAPTLVSDTISTTVATPAKTKKPRATAKPKSVKPAVVKAPAAAKKPRAPKAK